MDLKSETHLRGAGAVVCPISYFLSHTYDSHGLIMPSCSPPFFPISSSEGFPYCCACTQDREYFADGIPLLHALRQRTGAEQHNAR
jgi:hypothetical protein